ncbi:hypothetical protein [Kordia sp.]|uniref:hypothetical protein n=1 Tax=Kordia sp. TaxID=1965332 RepID=UPI0025BC67E0|nr:hypothetical protein [Kordia sp.]MCH2196473.1 hypothetical protein [Kordia sp.]
MKKIILILAITIVFACKEKQTTTTTKTTTQKQVVHTDNEELKNIYKEDQGDRKSCSIDWKVVSKNDSFRRVRIHQLLKEDKVYTHP